MLANVTGNSAKPDAYVDRLLAELDEISASYAEILGRSSIRNVDPNRGSKDIVFIGAPKWGWVPSDDAETAARMALLRSVRDWGPRCRLLFPHPTPEVSKRLDKGLDHLERWLVRKRGGAIPPNISQALERVEMTVRDLRSLGDLLPADEYLVRVVVDTNTLLDDPDLTIYKGQLGGRYMVHVPPVVLREIDDHKRGGRNQDLREASKRADRRLKGLRDNGDVRVGARVAGDIFAVFEHIEPKTDGLPSWLDLTVPDDRFVASTLMLQSAHPGSAVYVATSDLNLQTKLAAVGLPFVEPV